MANKSSHDSSSSGSFETWGLVSVVTSIISGAIFPSESSKFWVSDESGKNWKFQL